MIPRNPGPEFEESDEDPSDTLAVVPGSLFDSSSNSSRSSSSSAFSLDGRLRPGEVIGDNYEIIDLIGEGGMGCVYSVRHRILQKNYAMKVLSSEHISEKSWRRLQVEAQAIARMNHPNIVGIHNLGLHQGNLPYYVMDLLRGTNLSQRLKNSGRLSVQEALPVFVEICKGVDYAHKKGIVHRDIKPANIILLEKPDVSGSRVKVVDFGIAKLAGAADPANQNLTSHGEVFGTPAYMSPEQCEGGRIDPRSDIYSIGCTFFEALTGSPPFHGSNQIQTMMMHQNQRPPTLKEASGGLDFPDSLETLVATMLAKAPMDRYQSLDKVADDLQAIDAGKEIDISPFNSYKGSVGSRKRLHETITAAGLGSLSKRLVVLSVLAICVLSGVGGIYLYNSREHNEQPKELPKFSKLIDSGRTIQYEFPKDRALGTIGSYDQSQSFQLAQATVTFPAHTRVTFIADSSVFVDEPQLFGSFRPDDLYALTVRPQLELCALKPAMPYIGNLTSLRRLSVEGANIDDSDVAYLSKLTSLEVLDVNLTGLTGRGMSKLSSLRNLTQLLFNQNKDIYPMLKALEGSERISTLYLELPDPLLSEEDNRLIGTLKNLESLGLGDSGATDKTLESLAKLKKLRNLDLTGCSISREALARFRALDRKVRLNITGP